MSGKKDGTLRWLDETQFKDRWSQRNARLLEMLQECSLKLDQMSFTEYGCGPRSPFAEVGRGFFKSGNRADIKAWDPEVTVVDLNDPNAALPPSDIGVLSGVLEYLNDPARVLAQMRSNHEILALSYMVFGRPRRLGLFLGGERETENCVRKLRQRSFQHGVRNHLTFFELLRLVGEFGYIENAGKFRSHVLLILRSTQGRSCA